MICVWCVGLSLQVCQSAQDYQGYDGELGLCVCREPPGRAVCGSLCKNKQATELKLQCQSNGEIKLLWSKGSQVNKYSCRFTLVDVKWTLK